MKILGLSFVMVTLAMMPTMEARTCGAIQNQTGTCQGTLSGLPCTQQLTISTVYSVNGGYNIQQGFTSCCNANHKTFIYQGGTCQTAELKKPDVQERLRNLAKQKMLLVAGCNGRYENYVVHLESPMPISTQLKSTIQLGPTPRMELGQ